MTATIEKKYRAHTIYRNSAGDIVPGVTTFLGVLAKPAIYRWNNKMGLEGIDTSRYVDEMATIGTLAHYLIMKYLQKEEPVFSEYSQEQIDKAENCVLSFFEWEKHHDLKPILIEEPMVSEAFQYGGQIDLFANLDGQDTLIDFKTGKGIYPEMFCQLAAYVQLLVERELLTGEGFARILRIGRDENEGFEDRSVGNLVPWFEIAMHCLDIYRLKKELKWN